MSFFALISFLFPLVVLRWTGRGFILCAGYPLDYLNRNVHHEVDRM